MRRVIGGDDSLCRIHDGVAIERRRLEAAADVARLRVETLRQVVARQDAADLPECSCPSVVQAVRAGFGGEVLPECALHAGPSIPAQMNIPIGDDSALIALLGQHGLLPTNDL